jgi:subtilisin family serine protease
MATPKPTSRRRTTSRRSRGEAASFPDRIFALASPRSVGGISLFEAGGLADPLTVGNFESEPDLVQRAVYLLQDAGFEVLQATSIMINIAGSRSTYESAFQTTLVAEERETIKERGRVDPATFFDSPDTEVSGLISTANTRFEEVLEGVAIEEPRYLMAPSPFPPAKGYWHLDVPGDVSLGCNADQAHRAGITGAGVRVAMVDSGWYRHPFFQQRGYRAAPVVLGPGTANPDHDEVGHGTGESANLFAVAPDIELVPVKAMLSGSLNTVLTNATAAFNAAVGVNPAVITNSWGFSIQNGPLSAAQQALAAAVAAAVAQGIVVVFSAGNGHWGFPGQHPDVISAGGVFLNPDGSLQASDYASGFDSNVYPGRRVPDLSGLVGMRPGASYIMLPVEPGDVLDSDLAGGTHPNGDETATDDGWAAFSGTSAAAPQVAGAVALVKQACPSLSPADVKDILMRTAKDVTSGRNHPNFNLPAGPGPDTATGNGLLDAHKAVLVAKLRCLSPPVLPVQPLLPLLPVRPIQPLFPVQPLLPVRPIQPVFPVQPLLPVRPLQPLLPVQPLQPLEPVSPITPFLPAPGPGAGPGVSLSEEDVRQLEQLVIDSGDDLEL